MRIAVNEIFHSIQGESSFSGLPFVFVRTKGCSLDCAWCDTGYAKTEGQDLVLDEVISRVLAYGVEHVALTGGEPLEQEAAPALLTALCDQGKTVLLETNGAMDISPVDPRVHIIMDIKCPDSGMAEHMRWANVDLLRPKDEVKFVLASREDYEYAKQVISEHRLAERCTVLISTVMGAVENQDVVRLMLGDGLDARFQLQMHKYIWPPDQRGV